MLTFPHQMSALDSGRYSVAAGCVGICEGCVEASTEYAKERRQFGVPIARFQLVQELIADMVVRRDAARMLVYRAAWMADEGHHIRNEAFMAKLYATEMAQRVTDRCLQIFGGLGYSKELPIQSFYRQVRVWRIGHGTAEIHRWMIARNLLGLSSRD